VTRLVFLRELLEYSRNRTFRWLFLAVVALTAVAAIDGWNRAREATRAREAAEATDHHVWVNQGPNGPHGAAHFARYAFRPTPPLAAFEPGVFDYAGAAVWMEAHTQNPTTLRRAEDTLARAPLPALSPGWVVRVVGSLALMVLLFPAVARERERGTLRYLAATGVTGAAFVIGKVASAAAAAVAVTIAAVTVSLLPALLGGESVEPGQVAAVVLVHAVGLVAFGLLVVAVSARCRTSGSALVGAAVLWLAWVVWIPAIGAQLATTLHPDVDELTFKEAIQLEAQTPFWKGKARGPAIAAFEEKVLAEYGAERFDDLGFSRAALELQAHEEFANAAYDRLYGDLHATHRGQDQTLRLAALASPLLAVERVSRGIAGTDLAAQHAFAEQAEAHRRRMIAQLNRDMMENAGDQAFEYKADARLWRQIEDFHGATPEGGATLGRYGIELLSLLVWLAMAAAAAMAWTRRALRVEAVS